MNWKRNVLKVCWLCAVVAIFAGCLTNEQCRTRSTSLSIEEILNAPIPDLSYATGSKWSSYKVNKGDRICDKLCHMIRVAKKSLPEGQEVVVFIDASLAGVLDDQDAVDQKSGSIETSYSAGPQGTFRTALDLFCNIRGLQWSVCNGRIIIEDKRVQSRSNCPLLNRAMSKFPRPSYHPEILS